MENTMKKYGFLLFLLFVYLQQVYSQSTQDSILSYFHRIENVPQEKLYLHLDKPFYGASDTIWFKGYLRNSITHEPSKLSNYFIVELIDRQDSVFLRRKFRRDPAMSFSFAGHLSLPPNLPTGDYQLRGYSNWMLNAGPEYFYSRNLKIGNSIDVNIQSSIEYIQENDSQYIAQIKFAELGNKPFAKTKIKYTILEQDKALKERMVVTSDLGTIRVPLPDLKKTGHNYILSVSFDDPTYTYHRSFYLPHFSTDYNVTFFPEGGHLLNGVIQVVAFKVQGANGLSKEVNGKIYTHQGDTLSFFKTEHDGMGMVNLLPSVDCNYFADIICPDGVRKQFKLPDVQKTGFSISLNKHRQGIGYAIHQSVDDQWIDTLFLIGHTRGKIRLLQEITSELNTGIISTERLEEGITHFLLTDKKGVPISERLCFVLHPNSSRWSITPNKKVYGRREKVILQIEANDKFGYPLSGDFSVSITDVDRVPFDSLYDDIRSNLLLTSDLKGYIENPGYYFFGDRKLKDRHLDLVMLTHGWRRFNMDKLTDTPLLNMKHFVEVSQSISGRVKGLLGSQLKKGIVSVFSLKGLINQTAEIDERGEFVLTDINFPDSTRFVIQARTKKGNKNVEIEIDSIDLAPIHNKFIYDTGLDSASLFMDDCILNS